MIDIDTVTKYYFRGEHAGYVVTYKNSNITQSIPVAEDNKDYQEIQQWISEGNTVIDNGE